MRHCLTSAGGWAWDACVLVKVLMHTADGVKFEQEITTSAAQPRMTVESAVRYPKGCEGHLITQREPSPCLTFSAPSRLFFFFLLA